MKRLRHRFVVVVSLVVGLVAGGLDAQLVTVQPLEPQWGDTLTVTYDTTAEGAVLVPTDNVRLVAFVFTRIDVRQTPFLMTRDGAKLTGRIPVEPGMSALLLYFAAANSYDDDHYEFVYLRDANGVPAPGAHALRLYEAGPDTWRADFEREIELHPDSLFAYRHKWFFGGRLDPDDLTRMVETDLATLEALPNKDPAEWLYVQVYGRMMLGDGAGGAAAMIQLLSDHGDSAAASQALRDYQYQSLAQGIKGEGPEAVEAALADCIERIPGSPVVRVQLYRLVDEDRLSLEVAEAAARAWLAEDPHNPEPALALAMAYGKREEAEFDERAIEYAGIAIAGTLAGETSFRESVGGGLNRIYLPAAYRVWARAALRAGRPGEALGAAEAAHAVTVETDTRNFNLLAEVWATIGDFDRAADARARAWRAGDDGAKANLRELYVGRHEHDDGFDDFFAELVRRGDPADEARSDAVAFDCIDLNGDTYNLDLLKGKVVVLNFWFIGCVPCRVEMPALNELVAEYSGRDDVVFVSFAPDPSDKLREFLEEKPFNYVVIPLARAIGEAYEVRGYPTHVIIDRAGRVAFRMTGGGEDPRRELRPLIERVLAE